MSPRQSVANNVARGAQQVVVPETATPSPETAPTESPSAEMATPDVANTAFEANAANGLAILPNAKAVYYFPVMFGKPSGNATPAPTPVPVDPTPNPIDPNDNTPALDWPQAGRTAQRSNYAPVQVNPPYCYTWKWFEAPLASRSQPVVSSGILYMGSMEGVLYARNATTGAPVWSYQTDGAIRNSAGVLNGVVVASTQAGTTYALDAKTGTLKWKVTTGASVTAPLMDSTRGWVYVASSIGTVTALQLANGSLQWKYDAGDPVMTSPTLSADAKWVLFGNEDVKAFAVDAGNGQLKWQTQLQGQSLAERYPVVVGDSVMFRSQPLFDFHHLLQGYGDEVMDTAGSLSSNVDTDWSKVRPKIVSHLNSNPSQQTFFTLNINTGLLRGTSPILYTFGNNDIPNVPVVRGNDVYVTYRARRGMQTDTPTVHVTTKYDAEIGKFNIATQDVLALKGKKLSGSPEWRMTSDEPAVLTMGGDIIWVDSWERFGGYNTKTGEHYHVGAIGNPTPGCDDLCGGSERPFFPLSGNGASFPFPATIVGEGGSRGGAVVANNMLYWRVLDGGLAAVSRVASGACPAPKVWQSATSNQAQAAPAVIQQPEARALSEYITLDLTSPKTNPPADVVAQLQKEMRAIVTAGDHLMPMYVERGFSTNSAWPPGSPTTKEDFPKLSYNNTGNLYWFDPGELLYTVAMAYPYLDADLQKQTKTYMAQEMARYSPIKNLPYNNANADWLRSGQQRERYDVPFRKQLNSYPSPKVSKATFYSLWLWSKNTGDWSFACQNSGEIKALYEELKDNVRYYADMSGLIGYARLAQGLQTQKCAGWSASDVSSAQQSAVSALERGKDFASFRDTAVNDFLDPYDINTGWSLPVFYGLTPEIGLFLNEQTAAAAQTELTNKQAYNAVRWWYLTRSGLHAEVGETSFLSPSTAWSHFLARAYIAKDTRATLKSFLDVPWGRGDLYSIQKLVATLQAP